VIAWIVAPDGKEVRYHLPETAISLLPTGAEHPVAPPWDGKEETLEALEALALFFTPPPDAPCFERGNYDPCTD
jgi:hypothetical protein